MSDIFQQASRIKLRFATPMGNIGVEDLWDLPLDSKAGRPSLYPIGNELNKQLQAAGNNVFSDDVVVDTTVQLRFDIVKAVIEVKKAERTAALEAKANADQKQKILEILSKKKDGALENMTEAELQLELAKLK